LVGTVFTFFEPTLSLAYSDNYLAKASKIHRRSRIYKVCSTRA